MVGPGGRRPARAYLTASPEPFTVHFSAFTLEHGFLTGERKQTLPEPEFPVAGTGFN